MIVLIAIISYFILKYRNYIHNNISLVLFIITGIILDYMLDKFDEEFNGKSIGIIICLNTGLRIGELCALQVSDIDFENGILTVQKTVQRVKNNDISVSGNTKVIITSPKTKSSIRKIPLPTKLLESIKAYISVHNKGDGDFLFSAADNKPLDVRTVQKKFTVILKRCGVRKVKFHILRHTFATKWANANFDVKSLSEILGHSSINTTLSLYVHPSVESKRKFIDSLYAA